MKDRQIRASRLTGIKTTEGSSLEEILERRLQNKEPIGVEVGVIHTKRADGTLPAYNIRTDRFDLALDGIDRIQKSETAKREETMQIVKDDVKDESTGDTLTN